MRGLPCGVSLGSSPKHVFGASLRICGMPRVGLARGKSAGQASPRAALAHRGQGSWATGMRGAAAGCRGRLSWGRLARRVGGPVLAVGPSSPGAGRPLLSAGMCALPAHRALRVWGPFCGGCRDGCLPRGPVPGGFVRLLLASRFPYSPAVLLSALHPSGEWGPSPSWAPRWVGGRGVESKNYQWMA